MDGYRNDFHVTKISRKSTECKNGSIPSSMESNSEPLTPIDRSRRDLRIDLDTWERLALLGGWQKWELDMSDDRKTKKSKSNKTKDGKVKRNF